MLLWTIQTEQAFKASQERGFIEGSADHVDEDFRFAYQWMIKEMRERLGPPPNEGSVPVWAWAHYHNAAKSRPDLRRTAHLSKGARGVRIEFEAEAALLSCFSKWHHVLNQWYLPLNDEDDDAFDNALREAGYAPGTPYSALPPKLQETICQSWSRVFNLNDDSGYFRSPDHCPTQATLWRIPLSTITTTTPFTAR